MALACLSFAERTAVAQPVSEAAVKAGFVYNFMKFTQWPQGRETLRLCTPSEQALEGHLAQLHGKMVADRQVEVRQNMPSADWTNCDVVFLAEVDAARAASLVRTLSGSPILSIGEGPSFADAGGMIGLYVNDSRMRFEVNLSAAQRAGITLNSQMIKLAAEVLK